ncbi:MAG: zonular occludens toxin domain-containing protein [Gammaproteobacteria bacterium]
MAGWVIQGVRGEGKTLCAVGKIREYLQRGCPVATNLDLKLDALLPDNNTTVAYRLPDYPRLTDFELLPPAYDPGYGGEDKNGLIVLDEGALWLNSREWNKGDRLPIIKWLLISRKLHWDLILIVQDHDILDNQVKTTLCDYLVVSSRLDRQKIPYLGKTLDLLGLNSYMPQIHVYHVYYGFSPAQTPVETWQFRGLDLYDGYNTNQRFAEQKELLGEKLIDMRATYTYLPAAYLTAQIYIARHQAEIDKITQKYNEIQSMATKKHINQVYGNKPKIIMLSLLLVGFLVYRFSSGIPSMPGQKQQPNQTQAAALPDRTQPETLQQQTQPPIQNPQPDSIAGFVDKLLTQYRPRLSIYGKIPGAILARIDFYESNNVVESLDIKELHALGVGVVKKSYGVDLVTQAKTVPVFPWTPSQPEITSQNPLELAIKTGAHHGG